MQSQSSGSCTKNFGDVGFAVISLGHKSPHQKTGFSKILHCYSQRDTSDSSRATLSPGQVLDEMQSQHTQCDPEERAEKVMIVT